MWECGTGTEGAFRSFVLSHSQAAFSRRHRRRRRLAVQLASEDRSRSPNVANRRSRRGRRSKSNDANAVKESLHAYSWTLYERSIAQYLWILMPGSWNILGDSFEQANIILLITQNLNFFENIF